jgi:DNA replication protein DnaC
VSRSCLGIIRLANQYSQGRPDLPLPVSRWHEQIGDPTLADGILDRLVHNAHRIEMRGDSMRKNRGKPIG